MTPEKAENSLRRRFWHYVGMQPRNQCWPWRGARHPKGYGWLRGRGLLLKAHRVAYELHYGPIAPGLVVMHSCDQPSCVNPAHLRLGTVADNNTDSAGKGRHFAARAKRDEKGRLLVWTP